ncbi:MAG: hypothetical protein LUG91_05140 [Ruminococcus sp.]|nr:hypothetical protein [Ruminococcus sp.]
MLDLHMLLLIWQGKILFTNPTEKELANRTPIMKQVFDSKKLEALGWHGEYTVRDGVAHTLAILQGE